MNKTNDNDEKIIFRIKDLVVWWKTKIKISRPLSSDDDKAYQMIIKEYHTRYIKQFRGNIKPLINDNTLFIGERNQKIYVFSKHKDSKVFVDETRYKRTREGLKVIKETFPNIIENRINIMRQLYLNNDIFEINMKARKGEYLVDDDAVQYTKHIIDSWSVHTQIIKGPRFNPKKGHKILLHSIYIAKHEKNKILVGWIETSNRSTWACTTGRLEVRERELLFAFKKKKTFYDYFDKHYRMGSTYNKGKFERVYYNPKVELEIAKIEKADKEYDKHVNLISSIKDKLRNPLRTRVNELADMYKKKGFELKRETKEREVAISKFKKQKDKIENKYDSLLMDGKIPTEDKEYKELMKEVEIKIPTISKVVKEKFKVGFKKYGRI